MDFNPDLLGPQLSDEEMNSDHEADPVHSSGDEEYASEPDKSDSDEDEEETVEVVDPPSFDHAIPEAIPQVLHEQGPVTEQPKVAPNAKKKESRIPINVPVKPAKTRKDVLQKIAAGAPAYECTVCHLLLLSKASHHKHTERHYAPKVEKPKQKCPTCPKEYKSKSALKNHVADSECWRKWMPGPMTKDTSEIPTVPETDGYPLQDFSNHNPAMLLFHFFDPMMEKWKKFTNKAGAQIYTKERSKRFKRSPWAIFRKIEALKWLTMFLAFGLLGLDRIRMPWRQDWLFNNPFYTTWTTGNRFSQISHATHFVDNEEETKRGKRGHPGSESYDRLWRIRDVITEFVRVSQESWYPGKNLTIDEMMVLFKGRWGHVQLMPKKPIKKGIKLFAMADAKTGYVLNFVPSTGEHYREYAKLKTTGATVVAMVRGDNLPEGWGASYLYKGHYLFTDNYYTQFATMEWLRRHGVFYCGTVKPRRRQPEWMTVDKHPNGRDFVRGEMKFAHSNTGLQLVLWLDRNKVLVASNFPAVTSDLKKTERVITAKEKRKKIFLGKKLLDIPEIIWLYNKFMKGVDLSDQYIAKCHHQFRTRKWFLPIWYEIISMCVLNSYIIYKFYYKKRYPNAPHLSSPEYRRILIESLRRHIEEADTKGNSDTTLMHGIVEELPHVHSELGKPLKVDKVSVSEARKIAKLRFDHKDKHHYLQKCKRARCHVHAQEKGADTMCAVCRIPMCLSPCTYRFHHSKYYKFIDPKLGGRKQAMNMTHKFL